jgi:hypothetical protein
MHAYRQVHLAVTELVWPDDPARAAGAAFAYLLELPDSAESELEALDDPQMFEWWLTVKRFVHRRAELGPLERAASLTADERFDFRQALLNLYSMLNQEVWRGK